MKFYFNVNNKTQSKVLKECGVRNVMLSYKYVKNSYKSYETYFDRVFLNPGNNVNIDEYYDFIKENDVMRATQFDVPESIEDNVKAWNKSKEKKIIVMPVLHVNYFQNLARLNLKEKSYVCLGKMGGRIEEEEQIVRLPRTHIYHGLAKGRLIKSDVLESIDSSTWLSGVRGRKTDVFNAPSISFGKKGRFDVSFIRAACEKNKEYLELVGLDSEKVIEGDYMSLLKSSIALYYIPMFKHLGIYEENFKL